MSMRKMNIGLYTHPVGGELNIISPDNLNKQIDQSKDYVVPCPKNFPESVNQGSFPICGLAAVLAVLKARHGRKRKKSELPSLEELLELAQSKTLTSCGAIYHIQYLKILLSHFDVGSSYHISNPKNYHENLKTHLKQGKLAIVALDIDGQRRGFPGNSQGMRTHWATVFGYFYDQKGALHYLVMQYGLYYIWSAEDLLLSNNAMIGMPNPRSKGTPMFVVLDDGTYKSISYYEAKKVEYMGGSGSERRYRLLFDDGPVTGRLLQCSLPGDEMLDNFACSMLFA